MINFKHEKMKVKVMDSSEALFDKAACDFGCRVRELLSEKDELNIIFSGGGPQAPFLQRLSKLENIEWNRVNAFSVDEFYEPEMSSEITVYSQLETDLFSKLAFKSINCLFHDAPDAETECRRYEKILESHNPDIVHIGIGISGHVGMNEPGQTFFDDDKKVRLVEVDSVSKAQLMKDPVYNKKGRIPDKAITITIPLLMKAKDVFIIVPYSSKAGIMQRFFTEKPSSCLPAAIFKAKDGAVLYMDTESFSLAEKSLSVH